MGTTDGDAGIQQARRAWLDRERDEWVRAFVGALDDEIQASGTRHRPDMVYREPVQHVQRRVEPSDGVLPGMDARRGPGGEHGGIERPRRIVPANRVVGDALWPPSPRRVRRQDAGDRIVNRSPPAGPDCSVQPVAIELVRESPDRTGRSFVHLEQPERTPTLERGIDIGRLAGRGRGDDLPQQLRVDVGAGS